MWSFRKKPEPPAPPKDRRVWNEDWQIGDTAEVVAVDWHASTRPWERLAVGSRWIVTGFNEGMSRSGTLCYFLLIKGGPWPEYSTKCFRKVRPLANEQSEIVERILTAKPGKDRTRKTAKQPEKL